MLKLIKTRLIKYKLFYITYFFNKFYLIIPKVVSMDSKTSLSYSLYQF